MMYSFQKNYKDLPKVLPLFPLKRVLLLPRAKLPLNLFENRYLHMFDYALLMEELLVLSNQMKNFLKDVKNPTLHYRV